MDGVLVDSMPYHARAWEVYLSQKGLDSSALNAQMHGKHCLLYTSDAADE